MNLTERLWTLYRLTTSEVLVVSDYSTTYSSWKELQSLHTVYDLRIRECEEGDIDAAKFMVGAIAMEIS